MSHLKGCPANSAGQKCLCLLVQGIREDQAIDLIVRTIDTYGEYQGEISQELRHAIYSIIDSAWEPRFIYSRDRHSEEES
jgi:hypothetical protein